MGRPVGRFRTGTNATGVLLAAGALAVAGMLAAVREAGASPGEPGPVSGELRGAASAATGVLPSPAVAWVQSTVLRAGLRPGGGAAGWAGAAVEAGAWVWADARTARRQAIGTAAGGGEPEGSGDAVWQAISDTASAPGLALALVAVAAVDPQAAADAALAVSGATGTVLAVKWVVGRARPQAARVPFAYAGPLRALGEGDPWQSMPSGHAAASRAAAAVWARSFPGAAPALYLWAALVALSRVELGRHWPSDVGVGAWVGNWWGEAVVRR